MNTPLVSIIVPVYCVEKYIASCARSIFAQSYPNLEIIFWDDCSPDQSIDVAKKVLEEFPARISQTFFYRNEFNRGQAPTRDNGYRKASGKYLLTIDSDDWIDIDTCASLVEQAEEREVDIVFFDFLLETTHGATLQSMRSSGRPRDFLHELLHDSLNATLCNKLIRRDFYLGSKPDIPEGLKLGEDFCITVQLLQHHPRLLYLPHAYYHYRQNPTSITHTRDERFYRDEIRFICYISERLSEEENTEFGGYKARVKIGLIASGVFSGPELLDVFPEINDTVGGREERPEK